MNNFDLIKNSLQQIGVDFLENEPLSKHTSFKIGGPARLFVMPKNAQEVMATLNLAKEQDIKSCVIGSGCNILAKDNGFDGIVVAFGKNISNITVSQNIITAEGGASLSQLCKVALENSLSGLEWAWGIPASVGGAVFMNAGAYGGEIKDALVTATVLNSSGEVKVYSNQQCQFSYRHSAFHQSKEIVLEATFALQPGNKDDIKALMEETFKKRNDKQPLNFPSAGSTFKRPPNHFAAALIDECGLKGVSVGGAQVSEKHAGFVINKGDATCCDVLELMEKIKETVYKEKGIMLEAEVQQI